MDDTAGTNIDTSKGIMRVIVTRKKTHHTAHAAMLGIQFSGG